MMTLDMRNGGELTISADGSDEAVAMKEIEGYLLGAN